MRVNSRGGESGVAGLRMPAHKARDERLTVALRMLQLTTKETALLPVRQQEALRVAVLAIEDVQQWCKAHGQTT
jgi:hypothetical protein